MSGQVSEYDTVLVRLRLVKDQLPHHDHDVQQVVLMHGVNVELQHILIEGNRGAFIRTRSISISVQVITKTEDIDLECLVRLAGRQWMVRRALTANLRLVLTTNRHSETRG